ncbi:hypothetical protein LOK49_LG12G00400 [Camellia lanceoleosa]|uniref:Uncharacterized protein n=1 Tax=Camellia lanceoleosa TaxID=1840588 RepID=A0ACC0FTX4_9ERIC|nr:hypothetical protein LOK49_LG12G00400 [Camellia lanceoleosa]
MNSGVKDARVEAGKEDVSRNDVAVSNDVVSIVQDTVDGSLHVMEDRFRRVVQSTVRISGTGLGNSKNGGYDHDDVLKSIDKFSKKSIETWFDAKCWFADGSKGKWVYTWYWSFVGVSEIFLMTMLNVLD